MHSIVKQLLLLVVVFGMGVLSSHAQNNMLEPDRIVLPSALSSPAHQPQVIGPQEAEKPHFRRKAVASSEVRLDSVHLWYNWVDADTAYYSNRRSIYSDFTPSGMPQTELTEIKGGNGPWQNTDSILYSYYQSDSLKDEIQEQLSFRWNDNLNQWDTASYVIRNDAGRTVYTMRKFNYDSQVNNYLFGNASRFVRDSSGNTVESYLYNWGLNDSSQAYEWIGSYYLRNVFNAQGREDSVYDSRKFDLLTRKFLPENRSVYQYNSDGRLTNIETETLNTQFNPAIWEKSLRRYTQYNAQGLAEYFLFENWDSSLPGWVGSSRIFNLYNSMGQYTFQERELWQADSSVWANDYKVERIYDARGNRTWGRASYATWPDTNYIPNSEIQVTYDAEDRITYQLNSSFDAQLDTIRPQSERTITFDQNGNRISYSLKYWRSDSMRMENSERSFYEYNSQDKETSILAESWNRDSLHWRGNFRRESVYDATDTLLVYAVSDNFNLDLYDWEKGDSTHYYYTISATNVERPVSVGELIIYPNPVHNQLFVKGMDKGSASIMDLQGRIVMQGSFSKGKLDVSPLVPGYYFIQIQNLKGEMEVKKFLKR